MILNGKTEIIGGWLGTALDKAGDAMIDGIFNFIIKTIGFLGNISLYVSIVIIAFGFYCLIFQYRKPLKIGFIIFIVSMMMIVIGGINE